MAVKERVVGGGYLVLGLGIVVVLLLVMTGGGMDAEEGRDELLRIYEDYKEARRRSEYLEQKRLAAEAVDVIDSAGLLAIKRALEGSKSREREARQLLALIDAKVFEQNADGMYKFGNSWFAPDTVDTLRSIEAILEGSFRKYLHPDNQDSLRGVAASADAALANARKGAGAALAPAEPPVYGGEDPVLTTDRERYRVFGLDYHLLGDALSAKKGNTSARIRWNRDVAESKLGELIAKIPEWAQAMTKDGNDLERFNKRIRDDTAAQGAMKDLLRRAAAIAAPGLPVEQQAAYADVDALANLLRSEVKLLQAYVDNLPALGQAFQKKFP